MNPNPDGSSNVRFRSSHMTYSVGARLVFFSACESGKTATDTNKNLCDTAYNKGADYVVGYKDIVDSTYADFFDIQFFNQFITYGDSSSNSIINAILAFNTAYPNSGISMANFVTTRGGVVYF